MGLNIYLNRKVWTSYDEGVTQIISDETVYECNITHNLTKMAEAAGIYDALWRPESINIETAEGLIPILESGLKKLESSPDKFRKFDAPNGWGIYDDFIPFVENYLNACKQHPEAIITVSR